MTRTITVPLGKRPYPVEIGPGLIETAGSRLRSLVSGGRIAVVTDREVQRHWGAALTGGLDRAGLRWDAIAIEPGEQTKSFAGLESLCDALLALNLERGDLIVAFGGGVVGDLGGFAAAIYKRGVDFVQIPTTLLAQVDSSVGGKTAIDTPRGKNLIGAFHQPRLVLCDIAALATLPQRELVCGLAEVLKYGLLGDRFFFDDLAASLPALLARETKAMEQAIARSVEMKAAIVAEDEREGGARALLNLGHTFGHAVEAETGFAESLKHGEAVGLGCAMAFRFSAELELCSRAESDKAGAVIAAAGLPTRLADVSAQPFSAETLIGHMRQDKKASGGRLTLILARAVGKSFVARDVDPARLRAFLIAEGAQP